MNERDLFDPNWLEPEVAPADPVDSVGESLDRLIRAMRELHRFITTEVHRLPVEQRFVRIRGAEESLSDRLVDLTALDFPESEEWTRVRPGVLAVPRDVLTFAAAANNAKADFARACQGVSDVYPYKVARAKLSAIFAEFGEPNLSIRQATRQMVVMEETVRSIAFTVSRKGRSQKRVGRDEAADHLIRRLGEQSEEFINQVLDQIEAAGGPLYLVYETSPRFLANIVLEDGRKKRSTAHSPILIPSGVPPETNVSSDADWDLLATPRPRQVRRDNQLDPTPILPGTRIHTWANIRGNYRRPSEPESTGKEA